MKDPVRLRDAKSPHLRAARDLLRDAAGGRPGGSGMGGRGESGPSLEQRDAMWSGLVAAIGAPPMPGGTGGSGGDPSGGGVSLGGGGSATGGAAATGAAGHVASATSGAIKVVAASAAGPLGKAAASITASKLMLLLGLGAVTTLGAAGLVESTHPASTPASPVPASAEREARDVARDEAERATPPVDPPHVGEPAPPEPAKLTVSSSGEAVVAEAAPKPATPPQRAIEQDARTVTAERNVPPAARQAEAPPTPAERASLLHDEARATADARAALRSGDATRALALLDGAARTFGGGVLGQEREALVIEALARSGATEAARRRARAFLATWPASAHAASVRPFAGGSAVE